MEPVIKVGSTFIFRTVIKFSDSSISCVYNMRSTSIDNSLKILQNRNIFWALDLYVYRERQTFEKLLKIENEMLSHHWKYVSKHKK